MKLVIKSTQGRVFAEVDAAWVTVKDGEIELNLSNRAHDALKTMLNVSPPCEAARDYITPAWTPEGYDTVVGWLAKNQPELLFNCDPKWDTTRDGWWLKHRCKERGIEPYKVYAPKALQDRGIRQVNTYPVDLIAERFAA